MEKINYQETSIEKDAGQEQEKTKKIALVSWDGAHGSVVSWDVKPEEVEEWENNISPLDIRYNCVEYTEKSEIDDYIEEYGCLGCPRCKK